MDNNHYCVIMAGGSGTRLWPASRTSRPKQFLDIADTGKTFLQKTFERFAGIVPEENILVVTVSKYRDLVMENLPGLKKENLLLEPYARDTAPCIAYASYTLLQRNPDAVMAVSPADHVILDETNFRKAITESFAFAEHNDVLMTLGVRPTRPDSNYGYIQVTGGTGACDREEAIKVKTFTEKPDIELAKVFIDSGEFFWNSGIFVWKADTICKELERHLPEVTEVFDGWNHAIGSPVEEEFISRAYTDCVKISIDYGVMEKTDRAWLFPARFGWSDIGSWESVYECIERKDGEGNCYNSDKLLSDNCHGNLFFTGNKKKLIAAKGLDNYVVVDTDTALLICPKEDRKFKELTAGLAMPDFENYR